MILEIKLVTIIKKYDDFNKAMDKVTSEQKSIDTTQEQGEFDDSWQ